MQQMLENQETLQARFKLNLLYKHHGSMFQSVSINGCFSPHFLQTKYSQPVIMKIL